MSVLIRCFQRAARIVPPPRCGGMLRPNSAVVFLNSTGAHRASIPSDAPPETDQYIYQLQLGPEPAVRAALNARLPAEHARRLVQSDREFKY